MNRRFGIEIEIADITQAKAVAALQAVELQADTRVYNHQTSTIWKIVPDGSVRDGFEVVSPILEGQAGLDAASAAINALKTAGAHTNVTCGFHVHFDATGLGVAELRSIISRYANFESQIDAFMPQSRRGNANTYCRSIQSLVTERRFQNARSVSELVSAQAGRYFKVNLQSLHRHGTIEFRQHNGIVDADRALTWIRMLDAFITESIRIVRLDSAQAVPASASQEASLTPSQRRLVSMIEGGNDADTLASRLGWRSHTVRAAITRIRQAGVAISSNRRQGVTYYGLATAATAAPRQSIVDALWNGIDAAIATFYRNRAAVLAIA
jgi:DNA-binding CsgD family transcriptional regulator